MEPIIAIAKQNDILSKIQVDESVLYMLKEAGIITLADKERILHMYGDSKVFTLLDIISSKCTLDQCEPLINVFRKTSNANAVNILTAAREEYFRLNPRNQ